MNAPLDGWSQEPASFETLGEFLRREREVRSISLQELSRTTRIPLQSLQHIERDEFDRLPGRIFARGFLQAYAQALDIDPEPVLRRFELKSPPTDDELHLEIRGGAPERGRRFGIAIAVVVLLILFTLALSIVLRPRHRRVPVELSRGAPIHAAPSA